MRPTPKEGTLMTSGQGGYKIPYTPKLSKEENNTNKIDQIINNRDKEHKSHDREGRGKKEPTKKHIPHAKPSEKKKIKRVP